MQLLLLALAIALPLPAPLGAPALQDEAADTEAKTDDPDDRSGIAREDRQREFRDRYQKAANIKAYDEMGRLIERFTDEAVYEVIDICLGIEIKETPDLVDEIFALDKGWRQAYPQSSFVMDSYEYFSLQSTPQKRERQRMQKLYSKANAELLANLEVGDEPKFEQLAAEFDGYAKAFDDLGDRYHASMCWNNIALCFDDRFREEGADLDRAWEAYAQVQRYREMLKLKDDYYAMAVERQREIADEGYGPGAGSLGAAAEGAEAAGGEAGEAAGSGEPGANPAAALAPAPPIGEMRFEAVEDFEEFERPNYALDGFHEIWPQLYFTEKGSRTQIPYMENSPAFERDTDSSIVIDGDGDGTFEVPVPIKGGPVLTEFELVLDGVARPWAFVSRIGTDQDQYQGVQVNMQPLTEAFPLFYVNAASMVTTVGETQVRIFDDNMDGLYGSYPRTWAYVGLGEGSSQAEFDCVVIGDGERAVPWSYMQQIDGRWYAWETVDSGTRLTLKPVEFKTGTLKLEAKGAKPAWLIVSGMDRVAGCYFDLAGAGSKGLEVPVGKYELYYGEVRKGKRRQQQKALILGNKATRYTVKTGETTVVRIGSPYGFQFDWNLNDKVLDVDGTSVTITGAGGERYERLWNAVPRPEVAWRKKGSRRGSKPEQMDVILDQDKLYQDMARSWHPLDLSIELKSVPEEGIEVQLVEKKNKLFGKIESAWKD